MEQRRVYRLIGEQHEKCLPGVAKFGDQNQMLMAALDRRGWRGAAAKPLVADRDMFPPQGLDKAGLRSAHDRDFDLALQRDDGL